MLTQEARERDFPSLTGRTYLNTAAEGIPPLSVREALLRYFADKQLGMDGREPHFATWNATKELVGEFFGLSAAEIGICSCSSEAYNLAALALQLRAGEEVIINDLDFPAGATPWLQPSCPATVHVWRHRAGVLHTEDLRALLSTRTRLVTVSLVSFFNGYTLDLEDVRTTTRQHSNALLAVDVTQALGRIPLTLTDVDLVVSSTHKWILASHGGGLVGVPHAQQDRWTSPAGGWFNLEDAFGPQRFERAVSKPGAASFTVGMPNFPAVYAIQAGLDYIRSVGVPNIHTHAQPLVEQCWRGIKTLAVEMLTPTDEPPKAGIIAFRHPKAESIHAQLKARGIHVMAHAGRLRVALHGYNTPADVETFMQATHDILKQI